jgi:hypothetical protein
LLPLDDRKGALAVSEEEALAKARAFDGLWKRHSVSETMVLAQLARAEDAERKLALFRRGANQEPHFGSPMTGGYLALAEAEVLWAED